MPDMPYKDKTKQLEYQKRWMRKRRSDWFEGKSCVECGDTKKLELDHIDPSKKVTHNVWSWTESRRSKELAKCQALCEECHLKKTSKDRATQIDHGSYAMRWHLGCECEKCKEYVRGSKRKSRASIKKRLTGV